MEPPSCPACNVTVDDRNRHLNQLPGDKRVLCRTCPQNLPIAYETEISPHEGAIIFKIPATEGLPTGIAVTVDKVWMKYIVHYKWEHMMENGNHILKARWPVWVDKPDTSTVNLDAEFQAAQSLPSLIMQHTGMPEPRENEVVKYKNGDYRDCRVSNLSYGRLDELPTTLHYVFPYNKTGRWRTEKRTDNTIKYVVFDSRLEAAYAARLIREKSEQPIDAKTIGDELVASIPAARRAEIVELMKEILAMTKPIPSPNRPSPATLTTPAPKRPSTPHPSPIKDSNPTRPQRAPTKQYQFDDFSDSEDEIPMPKRIRLNVVPPATPAVPASAAPTPVVAVPKVPRSEVAPTPVVVPSTAKATPPPVTAPVPKPTPPPMTTPVSKSTSPSKAAPLRFVTHNTNCDNYAVSDDKFFMVFDDYDKAAYAARLLHTVMRKPLDERVLSDAQVDAMPLELRQNVWHTMTVMVANVLKRMMDGSPL